MPPPGMWRTERLFFLLSQIPARREHAPALHWAMGGHALFYITLGIIDRGSIEGYPMAGRGNRLREVLRKLEVGEGPVTLPQAALIFFWKMLYLQMIIKFR